MQDWIRFKYTFQLVLGTNHIFMNAAALRTFTRIASFPQAHLVAVGALAVKCTTSVCTLLLNIDGVNSKQPTVALTSKGRSIATKPDSQKYGTARW